MAKKSSIITSRVIENPDIMSEEPLSGPLDRGNVPIVSCGNEVGMGTVTSVPCRDLVSIGGSHEIFIGSPVGLVRPGGAEPLPLGVVCDAHPENLSVDVMTSGVARFAVGPGEGGTVRGPREESPRSIAVGDWVYSDGVPIGLAMDAHVDDEFSRGHIKVSLFTLSETHEMAQSDSFMVSTPNDNNNFFHDRWQITPGQ
jgi:hypothetical protein